MAAELEDLSSSTFSILDAIEEGDSPSLRQDADSKKILRTRDIIATAQPNDPGSGNVFLVFRFVLISHI